MDTFDSRVARAIGVKPWERIVQDLGIFEVEIWHSRPIRVGRPSWLDLDVRKRTVLGAVYLAIQAALVLSSSLRPDRVFSFQMFNESSTITIHLSRRLIGPDGRERTVPTDGSWEVRSLLSVPAWFRWTDRVHDPILASIGRPVHAAYGVDAQLFRLQKALDDAASHMPRDTETRAIAADVEVRRNGHAPFVQHLEALRSP